MIKYIVEDLNDIGSKSRNNDNLFLKNYLRGNMKKDLLSDNQIQNLIKLYEDGFDENSKHLSQKIKTESCGACAIGLLNSVKPSWHTCMGGK